MSTSLWPHRLQHARLPCPSPSPRVYSNSCPLSQWCHSTISSSVIPFSSCLQSFLPSACFQMSQFFTSGGQSTGASASASASVLAVNIQGWFPLGWTGWFPCCPKGRSTTWIKIAGRNISNLRYADDTTLMAESEEELKASWWNWKRRVKRLD